ncbi:hypothetical protein PFICI_01445 [Pestalotiopsis fici W106-1]|uniref:Cupin type-1 domain-containing protein n=1 Tax=Pestalotiopsis fici (strain W106-1 / CGMCC3.15140) TaxID=1229662 RepID=W3XQ30_PESFW|nr:uncharacterized protein PFICI_01445 [Pestalotiopsis fici W106-1]ETS87617.1 hypothetical protein PFICI_01445 [Pestalotiopsis fici W106-1]
MKILSFDILVVIFSAVLSTAHHEVYLNVTAVTHINGESALQCWQLPGRFRASLEAGAANGSYALLGDKAANAILTVIPAGSDGGFHHAEPQWVYFITGLAHITLPLSSDQAWINGGKYGLVWIGDRANVSRLGHRIFFAEQSVTLSLLSEDDREPTHTVVRQGACLPQDVLGLATLGEKCPDYVACE